MTSLIKMLEVDFFTQMTQFSAILPARQALLPILCPEISLKMRKNRSFCSSVALSGLQNVFFMQLDHTNGG